MTSEHKAALAAGRTQGLAVRRYLEALERNRPRRGRRPSAESLRRQLNDIATRLKDADPLQRLHLIQRRKSIEARLSTGSGPEDISALEKGFVSAAAEYGARKGIDYATWREAGVPAEVLRRGGCPPERGGLVRRVGRLGRPADRLPGTRRLEERLEKDDAVRAGPERVEGALGVRHEPDDVARRIRHPGDAVRRAVRVVPVPQQHPPVALDLLERRGVAGVVALVVVDRQPEHHPGRRALP